MGKGGYRGGSTIVGPRQGAWFSNRKHPPAKPKAPDRLTPEQRRARIVELEGEANRLQAQLKHNAAQLRALHELVRQDEEVQRQKAAMRDHLVRSGEAWDRRDVNVQQAIYKLWGRRS